MHTPTPWNIDEDWTAELRGADGSLIGKIVYPAKMADAALIVRAVNAHADMLAALREVVAISDRKHDAWDRARAAIAKAEGQ